MSPRVVQGTAHFYGGFSATATGTVTRYHGTIADAAENIMRGAHGEDDHGAFLATIALCGTACEVAAAYAFRRFLEADAAALKHRLHESAKAAVRELLKSTATVNLAHKTQHALWFAMTGDNLPRSWGDWSKYKPFVQLRNRVVHSGRIDNARARPQPSDAERAVHITRSLHAHIKVVLQNAGLGAYA